MFNEQAFDKSVDTEHLFVLQCPNSEHVFEKGGAMSVALELEYEVAYPRLRVVPSVPGRRSPSTAVQRRRVLLGVVVIVLLVLLMLPVRALGGKTIAGAVPPAGQQYVVRSGDTIASIAARVSGGNVSGMERRLAAEAGSTVVVPGEHLLIP
jgi:hypothetical protein